MKRVRLEGLRRDIRAWISRRVRHAGASGVVLGISGGIDSAVCAVLAVEALGPQNVFGLWISVQSSVDDRQHAMIAARHVGVKLREYNMNAAMSEVMSATWFVEHMTVANTKSRLRALVLRGVANEHNLLVMGTSNATELAIGYVTKGGDTSVDIEPIAMFYKAEVEHLARLLKVPEQIVARPPSAGLWAGQTDEKELGMSYEVLDREARRLVKPWAVPEEHLAAATRVKNMNISGIIIRICWLIIADCD